jgi:menaquinone-dependent protoporphyrinogen oxidase
MKPILILYATREGQTRRIAEHLAAAARTRGFVTDVINVSEIHSGFSLGAYSAAILAASVHIHKHEPEITQFVKNNLAALEGLPTVFLSVSLSEAGAEDPRAPADRRTQSAVDVEGMIQAFLNETGWHPRHIRAVAGALMYSKYNFVVRFIMKRIARQAGAPTDASRDYEFTDWEALDRILDELTAGLASAG